MSRLFDFISDHGHHIAEKRALKADPQFAADHAARRVKPGIVLGSEGPGGLDGFFAEMSTKRKFNPWWLSVALHVHWWLGDYGPRRTWSRIVCAYQRVKRGYSYRDLWGFDDFLVTVIRDGVRDLNDIKHGWPGDPLTFEQWGEILEEIALGMQAHLDLHALKFEYASPEEAAAVAARDKAFDHLKVYIGSLWD